MCACCVLSSCVIGVRALQTASRSVLDSVRDDVVSRQISRSYLERPRTSSRPYAVIRTVVSRKVAMHAARLSSIRFQCFRLVRTHRPTGVQTISPRLTIVCYTNLTLARLVHHCLTWPLPGLVE